MDDKLNVAFLEEAARYFEKRPTGSEDSAHWSNVSNAENCRKASAAILAMAEDNARLREALGKDRAALIEECAKVAETLRIGGGTLSSWINTNESPMGATQRHIATAIRALAKENASA